jgi:signal transduction histidine kinase
VDTATSVDFCERIQASPERAWLVGGLPFVIMENGKEFQAVPAVLGENSGRKLGLLLMESRIRHLGGTFQITSAKAKGTKVGFSVPADKMPAAA